MVFRGLTKPCSEVQSLHLLRRLDHHRAPQGRAHFQTATGMIVVRAAREHLHRQLTAIDALPQVVGLRNLARLFAVMLLLRRNYEPSYHVCYRSRSTDAGGRLTSAVLECHHTAPEARHIGFATVLPDCHRIHRISSPGVT